MNTGLLFFRMSGYLKYRIIAMSAKGHGIHSPFVYDLVTRVFSRKPDSALTSSIENIRKNSANDRRVLNFTDLGAGSGRDGIEQTTVSRVTRRSSVPAKYGRFLMNMAMEFGNQLIIEFGTAAGISTMYLATGRSDSVVISMEGSGALADVAAANLEEAGIKNVRILKGPFADHFSDLAGYGCTPGLVFIDGDHRKKPLLDYFGRICELSDPETVIIIDDINYSKEMSEAWDEIKKNALVTSTIDIFRMGVVFFRKGMTANHYVIRY